MSQMKKFATQLAGYIYLCGYSEAQILEMYADLLEDPKNTQWLQDQINAIRTHAEHYRSLVEGEDLHRWNPTEE